MMGFKIFKTLLLNDFPKICAAINSPESLKKPKVKIAEMTAHRGKISHNLPNEIKKRYLAVYNYKSPELGRYFCFLVFH